MDEPVTFYVYRLTGAPRSYGYIIARAELPPEQAGKNNPAARRRPLIWSGIASDTSHALELAKKAEENNAKPEVPAP